MLLEERYQAFSSTCNAVGGMKDFNQPGILLPMCNIL